MSKTIKNEDTGLDEVVYTQAELDEMRTKDKEHLDIKLEEFKKGKTAQELESIENKKKMEEIQGESKKALELAEQTTQRARTKVVNYFAASIVGEDVELRKKLDENFAIVEAGFKAQGKDVSEDDVIREMMVKAASMAGLTGQAAPSFPMGPGNAPSFIKKEGELSDAEHDTFLKAVGYEKPKPKA